jgi:hypothetical protein
MNEGTSSRSQSIPPDEPLVADHRNFYPNNKTARHVRWMMQHDPRKLA